MRIGVMSDTHRDITALKLARAAAGAVDMWFHLGDLVSDGVLLRELSGKKTHIVRGNCDIRPSDFFEAQEMTLEIEGFRFLLCHGHLLRVKAGLDTLLRRAKELRADCALFGHTHQSEMEQCGGIWLINPGSPSDPRDGMPSIVVLEVDAHGIQPKLIEV